MYDMTFAQLDAPDQTETVVQTFKMARQAAFRKDDNVRLPDAVLRSGEYDLNILLLPHGCA